MAESKERSAVLVTGGTGALGSALVRALCAGGMSVVAHYGHDDKRALTLQGETGCQIVRSDIADENAVATLFEALPSLYAVVHCAGIACDSLLLRQKTDNWHQTLRVNATGAFLVARSALDSLESGGRLIFVASRVGERGAAGQCAYAASKAATLALMKCAAQEGAVRNLGVNAICPPFVPSAMTEKLNSHALEAMRAQSLSSGFGSTGSFVGAVQWLLSEGGAGISGQVIHCDDRKF